MNPVISVVIPVYNAERFLAATIESLRQQTFSSWEGLIALDPKSQDRSLAIARRLARLDPRLRILHSNGAGAAAARNTGLDAARGDYIAFLDADDLWLPQKLAFQVAAMIAGQARISCTAFRRISQDGMRSGRLIRPPRRINCARLQQQNCMLMSSAMVQHSLVKATRFRDIGCEDFAFWLDLLGGGEVAHGLQLDLVRYRIVALSRGSSKLRTLRESWEVLRARPSAGFVRDLFHIGMLSARGAVKHARF